MPLFNVTARQMDGTRISCASYWKQTPAAAIECAEREAAHFKMDLVDYIAERVQTTRTNRYT